LDEGSREVVGNHGNLERRAGLMESLTSLSPGEYAPFYETYVSRVPEGDILEILSGEIGETLRLIRSIPSELEEYRYQPDKWSVREVVGHMVDTERAFAFRALRFARGDTAQLPGMNQDEYAAGSNAASRPLAELASEFEVVRAASIALFRGFSVGAWSRVGVASGCSFTVRAVSFIIAGHEIHHRSGLEENYRGELKPEGGSRTA